MSGWFGSKNGVGAGVGASGSGSGPAEAGESGNVETEMSEEDWSNLQRVFDVEGHAEVAVAASASAVDDGVASEFSVAVGAASVAFVDDEIVSDDAPEPLGARTKHVEVLRAGLVGFVAGSRAFGGARADHRATVDAMDVDVSGAKMVRVAGEDSNGAEFKRDFQERAKALGRTYIGWRDAIGNSMPGVPTVPKPPAWMRRQGPPMVVSEPDHPTNDHGWGLAKMREKVQI